MSNWLNLLLRRKLYLEIPEDAPVSRQQFALFRIFSFVGTIVCFGVAGKMIATIQNPGPLPFFIVSLGIVMLFNLYSVKGPENLRRSYLIMLLAAFLLLHIVSYSCGGIRTAGTFYFSAIILYAYMLLGKNAGKWFTVAVICHVVYLYLISTYTDFTSFDFFKNDISFINQDFIVNAIMIALLIAAQGNYLQSGKNEVIQELEKQKLLLQEKNEMLEEKNHILNHYAENLEKTNAELRKFASVASHDLKSPLRAIGSLAGFIEDIEEDALKPESKLYMGILKSRVNRMDNLLNALLEYSSVTDSVEGINVISTAKVIERISNTLATNENIQIRLSGNFPEIKINRSLFEKVVYQLVKNSVVFNDKPEINIFVNVTKEQDKFWFEVKDNGPGIEKVFHERIFVIFQTLNARDEKETMGAGLAIVRKIVESWSGTIKVESALKEGTSIFFSIPFTIPSSPISNKGIITVYENEEILFEIED